MSGLPSPERLSGPVDVLEACESAFAVAYLKHLADSGDAKHVAVAGNLELIQLSHFPEPYDVILGRPHVNAADTQVAFWVVRINTLRSRDYRMFPELAVLHGDRSQFYAMETEDDEPIPYGKQDSRQIVEYIENAQVIDIAGY